MLHECLTMAKTGQLSALRHASRIYWLVSASRCISEGGSLSPIQVAVQLLPSLATAEADDKLVEEEENEDRRPSSMSSHLSDEAERFYRFILGAAETGKGDGNNAVGAAEVVVEDGCAPSTPESASSFGEKSGDVPINMGANSSQTNLDPREVFKTLPDELQSAYFAKDHERFQQVLLDMDHDNAWYHLTRCIKSGIWKPGDNSAHEWSL
mmetsp:Transcript_26160/g.63055  ORF Transcript_26160/g.63055 Transcript_26160/m.63055 type:complete len:210 (+) Transcript_26160:214-843(+)